VKVFKSVSVFAGVSIITSGISFLFLPILTKYLSQEDYGILSVFEEQREKQILYIIAYLFY
jgi:O-antigen/teichoic acid export membrane protein